AVLHASGKIAPRRVVSHRGATSFVWDDGSALDAHLQLADAQVPDVLEMAGQRQKIPVTGTIAADAHVTGTLGNLNGEGNLSLRNGVAYGEPYESISTDLAAQGKKIDATHLLVKLHGMQIAGNGGYDMGSQHFHGHLEGQDLTLSKLETVKRSAA